MVGARHSLSGDYMPITCGARFSPRNVGVIHPYSQEHLSTQRRPGRREATALELIVRPPAILHKCGTPCASRRATSAAVGIADVIESSAGRLHIFCRVKASAVCTSAAITSCPTTPSSHTKPIYAYQHVPGGDSITGVMVYTGLGSEEPSQHTVLIADINQGWVKQLTCTSNYSSCGNPTTFSAAAPGGTVQLAQGPDGNIYQLTLSGVLTRITPTVPTVV
jgi:hypothetical protein